MRGFLISLLCVNLACFAQANQSQRLAKDASLDEYLSFLNENNPKLKELNHRWNAAKEQIEISDDLPEPTVDLSIYAQEVETRVGPQKQNLGITQSLPWPGKRKLLKNRASIDADRVYTKISATQQQLHATFKKKYAQYYFISKSLSMIADHLVLLENLETVIDTKYRTGKTSYANFIRIELEMDKLKNRIETLKDMGKTMVPEMNALLGRDPLAEIPYPTSITEAEASWLAEAEVGLSNRLAENSPDLKMLAQFLEKEKVDLSLVQFEKKPDIRLGLNWINTGKSFMPNVRENGKDPLIFSVGMRLPTNRKRQRSLERIASANIAATEAAIADYEINLDAKLKKALFEYRDAQRSINLYRDSLIPKAKETLMVTLKAFEADVNDYSDVLDVEKTLLELALTMHRNESIRAQALADIEMLSGVEVPVVNASSHH